MTDIRLFGYSDPLADLPNQFVQDPSIGPPSSAVTDGLRSSLPINHGLGFPDSYGVSWGDVNGDGLVDLIVADCVHPCAQGSGAGTYGVYLKTPTGWSNTPDAEWTARLASLDYTAPTLRLLRPAHADGSAPFYQETEATPYCVVETGSFATKMFPPATSSPVEPQLRCSFSTWEPRSPDSAGG